jgi:putative SOS response-associated peptidase YedK
VLLRWGFGDNATFNVRVDMLELGGGDGGLLTLAERCILPAMGFYKWRTNADGTRQPFFVHAEDQDICGFAGFWERESCAIITVPANAFMMEIDGADANMPAILSRDMRDIWLYGTAARAAAALSAYPAERLVAYTVSSRVDSLDNNDETLIEPLATDVD